MRHFPGICHYDVQVKHMHLVTWRHAGTRRNRSRSQSGHPVRKTNRVALEPGSCLVDPLETVEVRIHLVMDGVAFQRLAGWMWFRRRYHVAWLSRIINHGSNIRRRLERRNQEGIASQGHAKEQRRQQADQCRNRPMCMRMPVAFPVRTGHRPGMPEAANSKGSGAPTIALFFALEMRHASIAANPKCAIRRG